MFLPITNTEKIGVAWDGNKKVSVIPVPSAGQWGLGGVLGPWGL